ncbi:MAG: SLC45 family MFS transporter [Acholeplasmataceae bacterium]|nr:SLC45 family MFS transporter [Acholeplasmataceae bacterium]
MKLDYKKVFFVGLAFFLISMFWQAYDNIIAKILIDKFGLNQTWSGVVMALDNILALFLLPLFGHISDKTNSKMGRRTPFIIIGTIIAAFAFVSMSFIDNYQTAKIETETRIIQDYENIHGKNPTNGQWQVIIGAMAVERLAARVEGSITQKQYDEWSVNVFDKMQTLLDENPEGLNEFDMKDMKDFYYTYLSERAWQLTAKNPGVLVVFILVLLIALVAMATFRSPAVALMPDVVIKPLRSKANAIINLMGTIGGLVVLVLLMVFKLDKLSYVKYYPAFISVGVLMLIFLGVFLWKVKEPKLVKEKEAAEAKFGLTEKEAPKKAKEELPKEKKLSLYLILASVFLWFFGYNAVTSKFADYAPKVLEMGYSLPLMVAYGTALVAFIPIGIVATKIGRRKTILIGITILTICFGVAVFLTPKVAWLMYGIFGLTGIGWATINVNSYPMVVELSKNSNVGKYTGYYYTFSMAAQILTPIISGMLMDSIGRKALFPYAAIFVAIAFITMFMVKHGDAQPIKKAIKKRKAKA